MARVFAQIDFYEYSSDRLSALRKQILSETPEYLLNVNEAEYIDHIASEFQIEPLVINFDGIEASVSERAIPAAWHSFEFNMESGTAYPRQVFQFHLPFSGDHYFWSLISRGVQRVKRSTKRARQTS
jgi:hypothetical protein